MGGGILCFKSRRRPLKSNVCYHELMHKTTPQSIYMSLQAIHVVEYQDPIEV